MMHRLALNGAPQHPHLLAQFSNLLLTKALIDGIAFHEVVLEGVSRARIKSFFRKKKSHFATCPVFIGVRAVALWWH